MKKAFQLETPTYGSSSLLCLLPLSSPSFQKLENGFFHLLWSEGLREVLFELIAAQRHSIRLSLLFFGHDGRHHIECKFVLLAEFLQTLSLGEGRGGLFHIHGFEHLLLFCGLKV